MIEYFASTYFLGIIFMSLSCTLFLGVFFPSWYYGNPRQFWVARLTYADDEDQQKNSRAMWVFAWCTAVIGSVLTAYNLPNIPHTFWWILAQTIYGIILTWLMAKAIVALSILLQHIWFSLCWVKNWICGGKTSLKTTLSQS